MDIIDKIPALLAAAFLGILFLQSGLDKVFDWKGNMEWLTGHFAKSPLKNMVPMMLGTVTVMEVVAGIASAVGVVLILAMGNYTVAFWGAALSGVSLTALFFGQRIAKDYAGAGNLVPYFILSIITMYLCSHPW